MSNRLLLRFLSTSGKYTKKGFTDLTKSCVIPVNNLTKGNILWKNYWMDFIESVSRQFKDLIWMYNKSTK